MDSISLTKSYLPLEEDPSEKTPNEKTEAAKSPLTKMSVIYKASDDCRRDHDEYLYFSQVAERINYFYETISEREGAYTAIDDISKYVVKRKSFSTDGNFIKIFSPLAIEAKDMFGEEDIYLNIRNTLETISKRMPGYVPVTSAKFIKGLFREMNYVEDEYHDMRAEVKINFSNPLEKRHRKPDSFRMLEMIRQQRKDKYSQLELRDAFAKAFKEMGGVFQTKAERDDQVEIKETMYEIAERSPYATMRETLAGMYLETAKHFLKKGNVAFAVELREEAEEIKRRISKPDILLRPVASVYETSKRAVNYDI